MEHLPSAYDRTTTLYTGSSISTGSFNAAQRFGTSYAHEFVGNVTYAPDRFLGGNHTWKAGFRMFLTTAGPSVVNHTAGNYLLIFDTVNGRAHQPVEMLTFSLPVSALNRLNLYGGFVTDQWQIGRRLTFNLGLRLERQHSWVPEQTQQASQFATAASYPLREVGIFRDWAPRAAMAWDVTGDAKTVAKFTYGRFNTVLNYYNATFAAPFNQGGAAVTNYRWHDLNQNANYDPGEVDLSLTGLDFISITSGTNSIINPNFEVPSTHEITASIERELLPNMAGRLLYVSKRLVNNFDTINVGRPYSAFDIPLTRRDPGPDGNVGTADDGSLVTIYDFSPAYQGSQFVVNQYVNRPASRPDHAQTIEASVTKRLSNGWSLGGSYDAIKQNRWIIGTFQNPNDAYNENVHDRTWTHIMRLNGSYMMPWQILFGGTLVVQQGDPSQRTNVFRAADPNGGPPLRQLSTVTLRLEPYGTRRLPTQQTLNLRLGKVIGLGQGRELQFTLDCLNTLNSNFAQIVSFVSGPTYGQTQQIMTPRVFQVGLQFNF
jgi:hypothetical protein